MSAVVSSVGAVPFDLDSADHIGVFIDRFYARVLADPVLAPIFVDVAGIDLSQHLPLIKAYWRKLLLGDKGYQRHTMNIHRAVNAKQAFDDEAFARWLALFRQTALENCRGPCTERALSIAGHIAHNMRQALAVPTD